MREPRKYRFSRLGNVTWLSLVFWEREGSRYEKENKNEINKKNKITKEKMYFTHSFLIKRPTSVIIFYLKQRSFKKKTKKKIFCFYFFDN
jgi:hypothetical protein